LRPRSWRRSGRRAGRRHHRLCRLCRQSPPEPLLPISLGWLAEHDLPRQHDSGTIFDAGAILIQNTTGATVTVNDVFVSGFDNGATFDLRGVPGALPNNSYMILTQTTTNDSKFDTSDQLINFGYPDLTSGFTPANPYAGNPLVRVTINGVATTLADTGHTLDTGGFDAATFGINGSNYPYNPSNLPQNESLQWRPIGTTGVGNPGGSPPGAPEPGTLTLGVLGMLCSGAVFGWRRRASRRPAPR
jgi:hypothetical protein